MRVRFFHLFLVLGFFPSAHAQTTNNSLASGSWVNPAIWSAGVAPTNAGANVGIFYSISAVPAGLSLGNLTIGSGGNLTTLNTVDITSGSLNSAGILSAVLSDSGAFTISPAATNNGTLNILSGGSLSLVLGTGTGYLYGSGGIINLGSMSIQGQGTFNVGCGFNNRGGTASISNNQVLVLGGGGSTTSSNTTFNVAAGGWVDLAGLGSGGIWTALLTGTGGGTVVMRTNQIYGNNLQLNFPAGMFWFTGGTINGANGSPITNNGYVNISAAAVPANAPSFYQTFYNYGSMMQTNTGTVAIVNHLWPIKNQAAGQYIFQSDGVLTNGELDNFGLVEKTGGTNTSLIASAFYNTGGTVQVSTGTLLLGGGGVSSNGTFVVSPGAVCDLNGSSSPTWSGLLTGSGGGTVQINGGGLLQGSSGVTFNFPGSMLQWLAGTLGAPTSGGLTNLGTFNLLSTSNLTCAVKFYNAGNVRISGNSNLVLNTAVALENLAGATNEIATDASILGGTMDNWGVLRKSGGTGTSAIGSTFNNYGGALRVDSGALAFTNQSLALSNSSLTVLINGTNAGEWGKLVGGTVSLGGPLNVVAAQTILINAGTQLRILACTNLVGVFSSNTVPAGFAVNYDANGAYLLATNTVLPPLPATAPQLLSPATSSGLFTFSFQTVGGQNYSIQHNDDLGGTNWLTDTNFTGDGLLAQIALTISNQPSRFYRLSQN